MPLPDGSARWIYIYAQRQTTAEGLSPWAFGLVMDVTEQKRAEEEARHRGEMLALASTGAGVGTWSWYPQQDWAEMDEISLELHGLSGTHPKRPTLECNSTTHPDDLPELNRLEADLAAGLRERFDFAYRVRRPDGSWRWLMDRSRVTGRDAEGRVTRVSGVTVDIDSEKARESELAEQRLRLALALKASRQGLWDFDVEKGEQYVDERYAEITGLAPDLVLRRPTAFNELIHEQDRPRFVAAASSCVAGETLELSFEGRLMAPDGRLKWVSVEGAVVKLKPDGTAARLIGTLSDITERRRMDQLVRAGEVVAATGSYEYDAGAERFYWSRGHVPGLRLSGGLRATARGDCRLAAAQQPGKDPAGAAGAARGRPGVRHRDRGTDCAWTADLGPDDGPRRDLRRQAGALLRHRAGRHGSQAAGIGADRHGQPRTATARPGAPRRARPGADRHRDAPAGTAGPAAVGRSRACGPGRAPGRAPLGGHPQHANACPRSGASERRAGGARGCLAAACGPVDLRLWNAGEPVVRPAAAPRAGRNRWWKPLQDLPGGAQQRRAAWQALADPGQPGFDARLAAVGSPRRWDRHRACRASVAREWGCRAWRTVRRTCTGRSRCRDAPPAARGSG